MSSPFDYYFPPIFFSGELSSDDEECYQRFLKCVQSKVLDSDTESDTNSEVELFIEDKQIGKVIGKKGDVITKIRKQSGATIKIFDRFFGTKRKIKITGKQKNVDIAKEKIMECIPVC